MRVGAHTCTHLKALPQPVLKARQLRVAATENNVVPQLLLVLLGAGADGGDDQLGKRGLPATLTSV